jgi:hypothetical protein
VPSFGPRMRCSRCGKLGATAVPNWIERAGRLPGRQAMMREAVGGRFTIAFRMKNAKSLESTPFLLKIAGVRGLMAKPTLWIVAGRGTVYALARFSIYSHCEVALQ